MKVPMIHIHLAVCIGEGSYEAHEVWGMLKAWVIRRVGPWFGVVVHEGWLTVDMDDDGIHIVPLGDGLDHVLVKDECVCGPHQESVASDSDKPDSWLYVHASLDGRELTGH
jgi:hypothetical protein